MDAAVITISDRASAGEYTDTSGPLAAELLADHDLTAEVAVVPDDPQQIRRAIRRAIKDGARFVLTVGGTGIAPRDVTPEVTRELVDVELPGIIEAIRARGAQVVATAVLSRAVAGIVTVKNRPAALVVNAPGSSGGVRDTIAVAAPLVAHVIDQLEGGDHHRDLAP